MKRLTLMEIIKRSDSFMKEGKLECDRCLSVVAFPDDENQILRRLCDKCFKADEERRKEAESAEVGRTSSPESFELREDLHGHSIISPEYRGPGTSIAARSDARWYKKAGGSGDG